MNLHIAISAEPIFNFGAFEITNSMLISVLTSIFLISIANYFYKHHQDKKKSKPILFIQIIVESFYEFVHTVTPKAVLNFFPIVATILLFITFANWSGLLPGVETIGFIKHYAGKEHYVPLLRGGTADLNMTFGLAIFAVLSIQFYGYKALGFKYFKKFIDFSNPINFFVGFLELISEFAKVMSFSFRLFGNIFAGEVLLTVVFALLPIFAPLPFIGLELFVGFIQALVFSTLTLVFIDIATSGHHWYIK